MEEADQPEIVHDAHRFAGPPDIVATPSGRSGRRWSSSPTGRRCEASNWMLARDGAGRESAAAGQSTAIKSASSSLLARDDASSLHHANTFTGSPPRSSSTLTSLPSASAGAMT